MERIIKKLHKGFDYNSTKSGFALLYAVIISSIVLAIALSVSSMALKEVIFSTSTKEANDAFYAADTAAECALFYDNSTDQNPFLDPAIVDLYCNNTLFTITSAVTATGFSFKFFVPNLGIAETSCANVVLEKNSTNTETKVTSIGYNKATFTSGECVPVATSVQRVIEVNY